MNDSTDLIETSQAPAASAAAARVLEKVARIARVDAPLAQVLDSVALLAKELIPGAEEVSVTLAASGEGATAATTGPLASDLDASQYAADAGPCLDAARYGRSYAIADMRAETRWPSFAAHAAEAGVGSSLAIPLVVDQVVIGALNVYGAAAGTFDAADDRVAEACAGYAAAALHSAQTVQASSALAEQMKQAIASRAEIEQAKGILMAERRIGADEAFAVLRELSQTSNRKLRDVAVAVVALVRP